MKRLGFSILVISVFGLVLGASPASAQGDRMKDYQRKLEDRLNGLLKARGTASDASVAAKGDKNAKLKHQAKKSNPEGARCRPR